MFLDIYVLFSFSFILLFHIYLHFIISFYKSASRISQPPRGVPGSTYHLPKTAWKWKKLDRDPQCSTLDIYGPQGKVMFSQASTIGLMATLTAHPCYSAVVTHPTEMLSCYCPQRSWGKVIFSEVCVKNSVHIREQCLLGNTDNKRAVRILLECFLVVFIFSFFCGSGQFSPSLRHHPQVNDTTLQITMFLKKEISVVTNTPIFRSV